MGWAGLAAYIPTFGDVLIYGISVSHTVDNLCSFCTRYVSPMEGSSVFFLCSAQVLDMKGWDSRLCMNDVNDTLELVQSTSISYTDCA
jgi:hypothetical protein